MTTNKQNNKKSTTLLSDKTQGNGMKIDQQRVKLDSQRVKLDIRK